MSDVTQILSAIEKGDPHATEELLPLVYNELRRLAAQKLAHEDPGLTLQATALVHEAYVRLVDGDPARNWDHRGHFFAAAAEAMRRILIENARRRRGPQHGGNRRRLNLNSADSLELRSSDDLLALDDALTKFAAVAPLKAELVKLRFFAGMTITEAAAAMGVSRATAERYWTYARVWLYCELLTDAP
ncbi:MAG TPA: ECF-type sigma factor [Planctomycetaceae bacterium]|jgi:RNA polymerase sigma factor (TIGR02999 family)|nr:ECF-type sigma factor [Planctomycetaceae bacterium]